jgi:hypothetical protein
MASYADQHGGGVPGSAQVTNASTLVIPRNFDRKYCLIQNDSDTVIYLCLGQAAQVNAGIRLNANGGSYEINVVTLFNGDVYAIHGGAGNKGLCYQQGT